mmetsp:Transcript_24165/g.54514  ORF Transcript_24165/g.54514 Transcript_24165/m.54514 type:complete len:202 (-) Transcript_24165:186-791(-)
MGPALDRGRRPRPASLSSSVAEDGPLGRCACLAACLAAACLAAACAREEPPPRCLAAPRHHHRPDHHVFVLLDLPLLRTAARTRISGPFLSAPGLLALENLPLRVLFLAPPLAAAPAAAVAFAPAVAGMFLVAGGGVGGVEVEVRGGVGAPALQEPLGHRGLAQVSRVGNLEDEVDGPRQRPKDVALGLRQKGPRKPPVAG